MNLAGIEVRSDPNAIEMEKVIRLAIFPFQPGRVVAFVSENDFTSYGRTIQVTVENLRNHPYKHKVDDRVLVASPGIFSAMFYECLYLYYRNRPATPVDDHIVLGED